MNVRYKEDKKELDFNKVAEGFVQLYAENLARAEEIEREDHPDEDGVLSDISQDDGYEGQEEGQPANGHAALSEHEARAITEPQAKPVLPPELDIEAVREECEQLKADTRAECDRIIDETRAAIEVERSEALKEAKERGYIDGVNAARSEYDEMKQELAEKLENADKEFEKKVDELEPAFVELMIKLIGKITGILVDDRRDLILHIIRQSILGMENSNNYIIHVSKDDFDFVNSKKQDLLYELKGNSLEVVEDPVLTRAQCTIETDTRIFDCSLDVQLKNLIADLKLLSDI
jgi:flagellar assembly protein FliH